MRVAHHKNELGVFLTNMNHLKGAYLWQPKLCLQAHETLD
ncbi:hypothetical protein PLUTE_a3572 [Pseudoalteromonas luteoviolacea DSM 6061]|nr:hypothetical protein [Pseudoalteromonas luteoviolacea DSM 6061]